MQPNAEETRRRKNLTPKTATPNTAQSTTATNVSATVPSESKIRFPYKPKDNLPDIYAKFTQQLLEVDKNNDDDDDNLQIGESSKILEIIRNSPVVMEQMDTSSSLAKASTSKIRRTLFSYFSPSSQGSSASQSSVVSDVTIPETQELPEKADKAIDMSLEISANKPATPVRLTRRNSMSTKKQAVAETLESSQEPNTQNSIKTPGRLTRRNSFTTPTTPSATPAKTPRKTMRKTIFASVEEEEPSCDSSNMNLTNIPSNTKPIAPSDQRTTCYALKNMEMSGTPTALDSLNTIMTTSLGRDRTDTLLNSVLRRKTMYTPQVMQETFIGQATQAECEMPTTPIARADEEFKIGEESAKTKPASRRRTLFTPNRVVEFKRDRILESEQLLNISLDPVGGKLFVNILTRYQL